MAEEIVIKASLEGGEVNKSLREMRQEMKELQIAMTNATDPAKFKALEKEFANLRNNMRETSQAMKYLDPGEILGGWVKFGQGVMGSFAAVTGAMSLFGVKNEQLQKIEQKSMQMIQIMMGLEQARQLLIDAGGVKMLKMLAQTTAAQLKLNATILMNPYALVIAAIAALAVGIYLLTKRQSDYNDEVVDSIDYLKRNKIILEELSETYKQFGKDTYDAKIELALFNKEITQIQYDTIKANQSMNGKILLAKEALNKALLKLDKDYGVKRQVTEDDINSGNFTKVVKNQEERSKAEKQIIDLYQKSIVEAHDEANAKIELSTAKVNKKTEKYQEKAKEGTIKYYALLVDKEMNFHGVWTNNLKSQMMILDENARKTEGRINDEGEWQRKMTEGTLKDRKELLDFNLGALEIERNKTIEERKKMLGVSELTAQQLDEINVYYSVKKNDLIQEDADKQKAKYDEDLQNYKELNRKKFEDAVNMASQIGNEVNNILSQASELRQQNIQNEIDKENEQYDNQTENLKKSTINEKNKIKAQEKLDAEHAKKVYDLKIKQWKTDRDMAVVNTIISGALASINMLTQQPPVLGIILAALSVVSTALAVSNILAQQPPSYAKGGLVQGGPHSAGGVNTNLEGGEVILNKNSMRVPEFRGMASFINQAGGGVPVPSIDSNSMYSLGNTSAEVSASTNSPIRVYVTEGDISKTQNKVKVIEDRSKF